VSDALPTFRHHPDPLRSGSIVASSATCRCCERRRGFVYAGPVYAESDDLDDALCPWCIADGSAHERFDATFVDTEAFTGDIPITTMATVTERTPGYAAWQQERWPVCCGDATAFLTPLGIDELRATHRELEGPALSFIIYELRISGGAATRMLNALRRDESPTAYLFRCLTCEQHHLHVDHT
jgi:uncharacterized protein CbrC (UPF0167 family)